MATVGTRWARRCKFVLTCGALSLILPLPTAGAAAFTVVPAGQWPKFHYDLASTGFNPRETILSPSTVGDLSVKWAYGTGAAIGATPAIVAGVVYSADLDGTVFAVDAATGAEVWRQRTGTFPTDLTVAKGRVVLGTVSDASIHAFEALTGVQSWSYPTLGLPGAPLVVGDTVYIATTQGQLYALALSNGSLRWQVGIGGTVDNGIAASGHYLFVGDSVGCSLRAVDARNGAVKWSTCVGDQIPGTPTVSGGRVFVGARDGLIHALDARTGAELWTADVGGENFSSASAAYGLIYIGGLDGKVYAFQQDCVAPCSPVWTYQTGDQIVHASAAVANGVVYIGSLDATIYALDALTGAKLWSYLTGDKIRGAPAVLDGGLYIGSFDHNLYAFSLPSDS